MNAVQDEEAWEDTRRSFSTSTVRHTREITLDMAWQALAAVKSEALLGR